MRTLPHDFELMLARELPGEAEALAEALREGNPVRCLRLNPAKPIATAVDGVSQPVAWWPLGFYTEAGRQPFTLDPEFHAGAYYVQDASSMFTARVVRHLAPDTPVTLIDACAAPGGKTTAAIDALPAGSLVIANEIVPARAAVLKENIIKWGSPSVIVTRGDTAALAAAGETADIILADVPCSGEGMMRKDPEAISQWSEGLVDRCAALQTEIIDNLWQALRPGGYLVYSTCTFNRRENELAVMRIIERYGAEPVEIPVDPSWGITPGIDTDIPCYRFLASHLQGEGLFMAVLRKPADAPSSPSPRPAKSKDRRKTKPQRVPAEALSMVSTPADMDFTLDGDRINAFPRAHAATLARISAATTVIHHGIAVATVKGHDLIPAHSLAMSTRLSPDAFPRVELDRETALNYLRREAIVLPDGSPRGFTAVTYAGLPLGWVKNLGNRSNNLYPAEYRIRI